jgi:hypothetical protein
MSTPSTFTPMDAIDPKTWTFKLAPPSKACSLRFVNITASDGDAILIRTERCALPFAIQDNKDAEHGTKKKLELKVVDQASLAAGDAIDTTVCAYAQKESVVLFGKQHSAEIIASMYRPVISAAKVEGQMRLMRLKINIAGEQETNFLMKTDDGVRKAEHEEVTKKTDAMAMVKPLMWVAGKQFGVTLTATDVLVFPGFKNIPPTRVDHPR